MGERTGHWMMPSTERKVGTAISSVGRVSIGIQQDGKTAYSGNQLERSYKFINERIEAARAHNAAVRAKYISKPEQQENNQLGTRTDLESV